MEKRLRYYIHMPTGALRNETVMYRFNRDHKSKKGEYLFFCYAYNYDEAMAKMSGAKDPHTLYEYEDSQGRLRYATKDSLPSDAIPTKFGVFDIPKGCYSLYQLIDMNAVCYDEE